MTNLPMNLDDLLANLEAEQAAKHAAEADGSRDITIAHSITDPISGETKVFAEEFRVTKSGDPRWPFTLRTIYTERDGSKRVSTGMHYSVADVPAFEAETLAKLIKRGNEWVAGNVLHRERDRLVDLYRAELRPLLIKHGFRDNDDPQQEYGDKFLMQVFDALIDHDHGKYEHLAAHMTASYKTDGAFRKAMREIVTSGKENARSEYPEQYREEDDKDDFYEEYFNEVLDGAFYAL